MNKTIALAAIVMVAVVMGMSAFVPAAMARGPPDNVAFQVCHRGGVATVDDTTDDEWVVMNLPNQHSKDKHLDHDDLSIINPATITAANCIDIEFNPVTWPPED